MTDNRFAIVESSLGSDALLFESMNAHEGLSVPFRFDVRLLSDDPELDLSTLLGQSMTVRLTLSGNVTREFSGIVASITLDGAVERFTRYTVVLRPWLWLLRHRHDCRIHQRKSVPEIVKQIFHDHGFSDVEDALAESYRTLDYSVQYRESDLNYVSRLLEEEGIYYFFKHEGGKHTLVLADSVSAHSSFAGYEEVPFYAPGQERRERDHLSSWRVSRQVSSAAYALTDFDFERPRAPLLVRRQTSPSYQAFEVFDYPGDYVVADEGERFAQLRLEELHASQEVVEGAGPVGGLSAGGLFCLTNFPRQDQNQEYLVVAATHEVTGNSHESGAGAAAEYHCSLRAMTSREAFRPARVTRKPVVEGPQTAIVVGKAGEEIWTDEHGRVKLQFHWDRYGQRNEDSSCWVRVAQIWAGTGFGGQFLPRIGQEVIVEFLEGDPDRPLITGRVYNGDNPFPYALPGSQTQSGIKSRSTLGGVAANANEIRLEDKKGSEQLFVQAEKDLDTVVKHCETRMVGLNRSLLIGIDESHTIGHDQAVTIGNDRTENVGANERIAIGGNRDEQVDGSETVAIKGSQSLDVTGTRDVAVTGSVTETFKNTKSETVALASDESVGAIKSVKVGGSYDEEVGVNRSMTVVGTLSVSSKLDGSYTSKNVQIEAKQELTSKSGKDYNIQAGKRMVVTAADDFALSGQKKAVIEFADQLTIKVGKAQLTMKKNGDVSINGKKINLKGSGPITLKGSKISQN